MNQRKKQIRVNYKNEVRTVPEGKTLEEFCNNFLRTFKIENTSPSDYVLSIQDIKNKKIILDDEEKYQKLKYLFLYSKFSEVSFIPKKPFLRGGNKPKNQESVFNSKCSECKSSPIKGIKYKCIECPDYEICENCEKEAGKNHGHPLLKLKSEKDFKMLVEYQESKNEGKLKGKKKNDTKDFRDTLERDVQEIKANYDILFPSANIRNALIRTKGNKDNAVKILFTELNRNNYYHK